MTIKNFGGSAFENKVSIRTLFGALRGACGRARCAAESWVECFSERDDGGLAFVAERCVGVLAVVVAELDRRPRWAKARNAARPIRHDLRAWPREFREFGSAFQEALAADPGAE